MSQISAIFGTDDDDEITNSLYLIANVSLPMIIIHETTSDHPCLCGTTEYERIGSYPRIYQHLQRVGLYSAVVRMGYVTTSALLLIRLKILRNYCLVANSYFAEMMLDLAERKPYLIFTSNESYVPGQ